MNYHEFESNLLLPVDDGSYPGFQRENLLNDEALQNKKTAG
jgi:hypothetical protein